MEAESWCVGNSAQNWAFGSRGLELEPASVMLTDILSHPSVQFCLCGKNSNSEHFALSSVFFSKPIHS